MITTKTQADAIWNAFWTGGISNPLEIIELIAAIDRIDEREAA